MTDAAVISFPFLGLSLNPPSSFTLFGYTFYWYGVIIACGVLLALAYCLRRCRAFGIEPGDLLDIVIFALPMGIVGARIYYVAFNYSQYAGDFWSMLKTWEGGLAIYGGIIAAMLTVLVVCKIKKTSAPAVMDVAAFGLLIGQSVGRWGNFLNREAYGAQTDIFCKMGLTENGYTIYVHPTFLYESLWNCLGFVFLHLLSKSKKHPRKFDGQYFLYYVGWYGLGRMFIEGLRVDSLYIGGSGIRISQLLAAISFLAAVIALVVILKSKKLSPDRLWVNRPGPEESGTPPMDKSQGLG